MNIKYLVQIIIFSFIGLCVVGQLYLPIPILNNLELELNIQPISSTWIISIFGYSYALGFLFFGPLSDRFGRKVILLLGMLLLGILTFLLSCKNNQYLTLTRGIQGFFAASYPPLILAYIEQYFPKKVKGIAISAMSFSFLSAVIIAQLFIISFANSSFVVAERILSVIYVLALFLFFLVVQSEATIKNGSLLQNFTNLPKLLFNQKLIKYFIYTFFVLLLFVGFYLVISSENYPFINELFAIRLLGFPGMFLAFLVPILLRKKTTVWIMNLAFFLQFIALISAGFAFGVKSYLTLILSSILITSGTALLVPILIISIGQMVTANIRGTAISLYTFILFCGASSAPIMIKTLSNKFNSNNLFIILSVISFILLISNRRRDCL